MSRGTKVVPYTGPVEVYVPELHPGQLKIKKNRRRFTVVRCGRRFGKTVYGKAEALEVALKGGKVGWVSPNNKLATEVWRDLVRRLRGLTDQEGGRVSEMERRIELPEGGVIEVWSSHDNSDIARGRDYDLVVVDEAGLIPDLSVLWDSALAPTLADRQGAGLLLGTPKGLRTAFNVMFADAETGEDPEWAAFNAPTTDNTTLPGLVLEVEKARRRAERRGTLALWTQEYLGIPADDGSNPFGLEAIARVATTAVRVKENELYPQWRPEGPARPAIAWGVDLARSIDYTVAIGFDELGRWCDCHRFQADWKLTKNRLIDIIGFDTPVIMDATGVGSPIVQDLYNAGLQVSPFVFTYRSRNKLVEELITGIHGARMSLPNNFVRTEMETVGVEQTSIGPRYTVPQGHHDDGLMAIGLAWMCFQNYAGMPDWPAEREVIHPRKDQTKFLPAAKPDDEESDFEILGAGW